MSKNRNSKKTKRSEKKEQGAGQNKTNAISEVKQMEVLTDRCKQTEQNKQMDKLTD